MADRVDQAALALLGGAVLQSLAGGAGDASALWQGAKEAVRSAVDRDPVDANLTFVLGATALFWRAEHGVNPKVATPADALLYVATCMSVGYSEIQPRTEAGKYLGSVIMAVGPALSARLLAPPKAATPALPAADASQRIVEKLDAILEELRRRG